MAGKRFGIIGAARSGRAAAKLLKGRGADVFISERTPAEQMKEASAELDRLQIGGEFGGNSNKVLETDVIVLSPGVPTDAGIVRKATAMGIPVLSEIEVAAWFCPCPIIAITGTNGKTTTTTLAGRILEDARIPTAVAGNIGLAFSEIVGELTSNHVVVLEVSSFQLDTIEEFRPAVSALLNITPDHLDRYEHSMDNYIASKCRVFKNQADGDSIVYNYDDPLVRKNVEERIGAKVRRLPFSITTVLDEGAFVENGRVVVAHEGTRTEIIDVQEISIRGKHNLMNALAASLAAHTMHVQPASLRATLRNFKGVEHRLEFVREVDGVSYVNDSKATNVDSVWYALQSFDRPLVLMLGGRDKGNDYSTLHDLVRAHVKGIVAIGESAEKVQEAFSEIVPVSVSATMEEAVRAARALAAMGDVVLLSPACASFDWFNNYEHRGKVFKQLVMSLK